MTTRATTRPLGTGRDGEFLELTPAFDLTPHVLTTDPSAQAMSTGRDGSRDDRIVSTIGDSWLEASDAAGSGKADRNLLWKWSVLDPSVFYE